QELEKEKTNMSQETEKNKNDENKITDEGTRDIMQNNTNVTKTTDTRIKSTNESLLETSASTSKEQQDTFRTNKNNNTHGSVLKRTEDTILNTKNSNIRENLETQNVDLTSNSTSNKETAQEVTSPMVIIDNNNYELQKPDRSEGEYITATNKRKKDKKK
ncbi:8513_t:CDS:2, partial [Scutellospora calospora]